MAESERGNTFRKWVLFSVGIGVVVYFAATQNELSTGWLLLIASMLGFSMLVEGVQQSLGMGGSKPKKDEAEDGPSDPPTA